MNYSPNGSRQASPPFSQGVRAGEVMPPMAAMIECHNTEISEVCQSVTRRRQLKLFAGGTEPSSVVSISSKLADDGRHQVAMKFVRSD